MLAPNTVLQNRYRVIRQIGHGGMGAVYEAIDERVSAVVALKETYANNEATREAFRREAQLLANLSHDAFPRVKDYFSEGDGQYLVMDFVRGNDLAELLKLRESPFAPAKVLEWADHLLGALEELHSYSPPVVHRDIKPSNLKLTPKGKIILLDFGIAKGAAGLMTAAETTDSSLGSYTPHYASLEQSLRSSPQLLEALRIINEEAVESVMQRGTDPRTDIYSLGATLYHLLTGVVPADTPTRAVKVWTGKPDPLRRADEVNPQVPVAVADVIRMSVEIDRARRPESAAAMRRRLREAAGARAEEPDALPGTALPPEVQERLRLAEEEKRREKERKEREEREERAKVAEEERLRVAEEEARRSRAEAERRRLEAEEEERRRKQAEESLWKERKEQEEARRQEVAAPGKAGEERRERERKDTVPAPAVRKTSPGVEAGPSTDEDRQRAEEEEQQRRFEEKERAAASVAAVAWRGPRGRGVLLGAVIALVLLGAVGAFLFLRPAGGDEPAKGTGTEPAQEQGTTAAAVGGGQSSVQRGAPPPPAGMVYVPGGEFLMGRDDGDLYERPAHRVNVKPFFIGIYEVTNEEYARFLQETGRGAPPWWLGGKYPEGAARKPVTGVTWYDASEFAKWANARLPTEEEWEFAARGMDGRLYPWGAEWQAGMANAEGASGGMSEVGAYKGASPFGAYDMAGNAWEWTASDIKAYPGGHLPRKPVQGEKVIRGGTYESERKAASATYRRGWGATGEADYGNTGFRLAKDVE